jgi:hypothetical protein
VITRAIRCDVVGIDATRALSNLTQSRGRWAFGAGRSPVSPAETRSTTRQSSIASPAALHLRCLLQLQVRVPITRRSRSLGIAHAPLQACKICTQRYALIRACAVRKICRLRRSSELGSWSHDSSWLIEEPYISFKFFAMAQNEIPQQLLPVALLAHVLASWHDS